MLRKYEIRIEISEKLRGSAASELVARRAPDHRLDRPIGGAHGHHPVLGLLLEEEEGLAEKHCLPRGQLGRNGAAQPAVAGAITDRGRVLLRIFLDLIKQTRILLYPTATVCASEDSTGIKLDEAEMLVHRTKFFCVEPNPSP